jgi:hypothetical protein
MDSAIVNLIAFFFMFSGIISLLFPKVSWWLGVGWQFKSAEPSNAALVMARLGGIISIAAAAFLFFHVLPNFK